MAWKPTISLMGPDIPLLEKEGEEGGKEGGKEGESHALTTGAVHVHYQYWTVEKVSQGKGMAHISYPTDSG